MSAKLRLSFSVLVSLAVSLVEARATEPFPLDLAFSLRTTFSDNERAQVSADGRHVAYVVVTPEKKPEDGFTLPSGLPVFLIGTRVHVTDVGSGESTPLGAEGTNSFSPIWSPDGKLLAYYSDEGDRLRAWIYDASTGKSRPASNERIKVHLYTTTVMPPTWSPDGERLLLPFLPADEADADPRPPHGQAKREPASDDSKPNVLVLASGDEPAPQVAEPLKTFSQYEAAVDLKAADVRTGEMKPTLPAKPRNRSGPAFARYSPSGRYLAYVSCLRPSSTGEGHDVLDIGVSEAGGSEPLYVEQIDRYYDGRESYSGDHLGRAGVILAWHPTEDVLFYFDEGRLRRLDCTLGGRPNVTALAEAAGDLDGDWFAFAEQGRAALVGLSAGEDHNDERPSLALISFDDGSVRKLPLPDGVGVRQVIRREGAALWQPVANTATFLARGEESRTLILRLDLATGEWTTLRSEPEAIDFHGMSRDGSLLVATRESYGRPPDFYRFGEDFAPGERLSAIEPRLDGRDVGSVEFFHTTVPLYDGTTKSVRTAVLLPPGAKKGDRLPAVATCYGGWDQSLSARSYGGGFVGAIPAPVFTNRGYAVLLLDAPIGPEGRPGDPVEELADVVLPQIEHGADLGYVDTDRVAIVGYSYGAYCAAALVTSTDRFRAAVAINGKYDLGGYYGRLRPADNHPVEWSETGQGRMGGPLWSDVPRYLRNSPYYLADRIRTPLLIIHGRADNACPVDDAEKMFSALRRLDRPAQLAVYDGEGHWVASWDRPNAIDSAERTLEFLERRLVVSP